MSAAGAGTAGSETAPRVQTRRTLVYLTVLNTMRFLFFAVFPRRIEGREHLPERGPALLVANHQSFLDIPLVSVATGRRHVSFVARDTLARSRFLAFVMRGCGAVLIRRGRPDRAALREMVAHLEAGDLVAIFPEGTRSADGRVQPFRAGALLAARMAGAPIVPVAIRGTIEAWPRTARLPRPRRVLLRYGPPVDPALPDALERVQAQVERMAGDGRFPRA